MRENRYGGGKQKVLNNWESQHGMKAIFNVGYPGRQITKGTDSDDRHKRGGRDQTGGQKDKKEDGRVERQRLTE